MRRYLCDMRSNEIYEMLCCGIKIVYQNEKIIKNREKNRPNLSKLQEKNLRQLIQACHDRKTPYFQRKFKVSP